MTNASSKWALELTKVVSTWFLAIGIPMTNASSKWALELTKVVSTQEQIGF